MQRAHLIKRQTIRREIKTAPRSHRALCEDPRAWVWACVHHHGQLDHSRKLRIPRHRLPPAVEDFARQYGLEWWLDREYGSTV